jgi:hypothetical protein
VEHLLGVSLKDRLIDMPTNIRIEWRGLEYTNASETKFS